MQNIHKLQIKMHKCIVKRQISQMKCFTYIFYVIFLLNHLNLTAQSTVQENGRDATDVLFVSSYPYALSTDSDWFFYKWADSSSSSSFQSYFLRLTEFEEAQLKLPFLDTIDSVTADLLKSNSQTSQVKMTLRYYASFAIDQYSLVVCAQHIQDRCKELPNTNDHWQTTTLDWLWVEAEKVEFRFIFRKTSAVSTNDIQNLPVVLVSDLVAHLVSQTGNPNLCSLQAQKAQTLITIDGKTIRTEHNDLLWVVINLPSMPPKLINEIEPNNEQYQEQTDAIEMETSSASRGSLLYSVNKNAQITLTLAGNVREILPDEDLCVRFHYWIAEQRTLKVSLYHDGCTKRLTLAKLTPTFTLDAAAINSGKRISWYPARVCFSWFVVQLHQFRTDQLQLELKIDGDSKMQQLFIERRANEALFAITDLLVEQSIPFYENNDVVQDEHAAEETDLLNRQNEFNFRDSDVETDVGTFDIFLENIDDQDENDFEEIIQESHTAHLEPPTLPRSVLNRQTTFASPSHEEASSIRNRINPNDRNARLSSLQMEGQSFQNTQTSPLKPNNKNDLDIQDFLSSWNTNGEQALQEWQMLPDHAPFIRWLKDENKNQVALRFRLSPVESVQTLYVFSRWIRLVPNEMLKLQLHSTLRGVSIKVEVLNEQLTPYILGASLFNQICTEGKNLEVSINPHFMSKYSQRVGKFKISIEKKDLNLESNLQKGKQTDKEGEQITSLNAGSSSSETIRPIEKTFTEISTNVNEDETTTEINNHDTLSEQDFSNLEEEFLIIKGLYMSDPCNDLYVCHGRGTCIVESAHSYRCECSDDFHGDHCEYENRCRKSNPTLDGRTGNQYCQSVDAVSCKEVENWFVCQCRARHRWDVHKRRCETISPCLFKFCRQGEICREDRSMATCECRPGHKISKITKRCEPDLCKPNSCKTGQLCSTVPGNLFPVCHCPFGQSLNSRLQACQPDSISGHNPFIVQVLGCNHTYKYDPNSKDLKCACFDGYQLESNEIDCKPIESFRRYLCPLCSETQICVQKVTETDSLVDVHYTCECRVGFYGPSCIRNVCHSNAQQQRNLAFPEASHRQTRSIHIAELYPSTIEEPNSADNQHQALPFNNHNDQLLPNELTYLRRTGYKVRRVHVPVQFLAKKYRGLANERQPESQAESSSSRSSSSRHLDRSSGSRHSTRRQNSLFSNEYDEQTNILPESHRARAITNESLNPGSDRISLFEVERKLLRNYCDNSDCHYNNHLRQFRCKCSKDGSIVDGNNGLCRIKPVCNDQERIKCSEKNAICVPRFQKAGTSLVNSCECPPGYKQNKERFCHSLCTFLHKTCEEMNARCEVDLRNNAARCICRAGHVFDAKLGFCVVTHEVLNVRMNIRLNHLRLETENESDYWSPPDPDDPFSVRFFPFLSDDDDLHRQPSASDKIVGPITFFEPNSLPSNLKPIDCSSYYQTKLCVEWLNKVNQLQRHWIYDVLSHIRLQYRLRRSLQAAMDRMLGPHIFAKVFILRFNNMSSIYKETSGLGTVFKVDFTIDIVKPKHIHSKQILELFSVSCVHFDQLTKMHSQPPFITNLSDKPDELDVLADSEPEETMNSLLEPSKWIIAVAAMETVQPGLTMEESSCSLQSGLYVLERTIKMHPFNLCEEKRLRCLGHSNCNKRRTSRSTYQCTCVRGFERVHTELLGMFEVNYCRDVDECADPSLNKCDHNSRCINTIGSYICKCLPGFKKVNDISCTETCDKDFQCLNGYCRLFRSNYEQCVCDAGYKGTDCSKIDTQVVYLQTTLVTILLVFSLFLFGMLTVSFTIAKKIELESIPKECSFSKFRLSTERFPDDPRDSYEFQILETSDKKNHQDTTHSA